MSKKIAIELTEEELGALQIITADYAHMMRQNYGDALDEGRCMEEEGNTVRISEKLCKELVKRFKLLEGGEE